MQRIPFLLTLYFMGSIIHASAQQEERVLIISGGGSRGAWGGGLIKALHEKENPDYRCIVGTSTGSLLAPLAAINAFEKMETGFTDVTQKSIFNVNPFTAGGEIRTFKAVLRVTFGKQNLGETEPLRKRIHSFFTQQDFDTLRLTGRTVKVSVTSLTSNKVAYMSTDDNTYQDMVDWIWASANQPVFMSTLVKNNERWVDGGLKENVPIAEGLRYAQAHGIKTADVVVNNIEGVQPKPWPTSNGKTNVIPKLLRIIDIFSDEVRLSDIENGILEAQVSDMTINLYFMSAEDFALSPNPLLFQNPILTELWRRGYSHVLTAPKALIQRKIGNNNMINMR